MNELRLLLPSDKEAIMTLAKRHLAVEIKDDMEREMQSWTARWRAEALDRYLDLKWSFGAFRDGQLTGFVLAQPLVFFRGLTQTLWIEDLQAVDEATRTELFQCASGWARDKHFQCVLLEKSEHSEVLTQGPKQGAKPELIEFKTARY